MEEAEKIIEENKEKNGARQVQPVAEPEVEVEEDDQDSSEN